MENSLKIQKPIVILLCHLPYKTYIFRHGGFSKWGHVVPDPMHTYLGLAGLSLMGFGGLNEMNCELNITKRTSEHLKNIQ